MARRNRRRKVEAAALPVPFVGFIVFVVVCGLVYVWLDCRCSAVGKRLAASEKRKAELTKILLNEEYKWVETRSPANVERALARYGIVMSWPRPNQVVRIRAGAGEGRSLENGSAVASYRRVESLGRRQ
jgi:hypothetical protein